MRRFQFSISIILLCLQISGCGDTHKKIIIENPLDIPRNFETVEISRADLRLGEEEDLKDFGFISNRDSAAPVIVQYLDKNRDGKADIVLFQPNVEAKGKHSYSLIKNPKKKIPDSTLRCYSRFVPERTDDYAWENNKVAFRTYGPTAREMVEKQIPGGTLSSGIDAWLKRVDYPIIDKWYKKTTTGKGSYHLDTGEGLDNYHVGAGRGVGGTAIKKDDIYHTSPNFVEWETLENGPLRTSFTLVYHWSVNGQPVKEVKHISLDYGSNLSRYEIKITGSQSLSAGISLHDHKGEVAVDMDKGWLSYWEPHDGSALGTGMVVPEEFLTGYDKFVTDKKDFSNLYAHMEARKGKIVFYAGFGWKEAKQFPDRKTWEGYLENFSMKLKNPLRVSIE